MRKIYSNILSLAFILTGISLGAQTVTFNYTGSVQTFTVPACVTAITVDVKGGKGGNNATYLGGNGGRVQASIPVTPGEVLQIYVGAIGVNTSVSNPPVYNGGGGVYSYVSAGPAGTGGGGSDIRRTPYANGDRLVVAGGGGGGGYVNIGGHGGGLIGQDGVPYPSWPNSGGKGGTQVAGGAGGIACCSCPTYTTSGAFFQGGNGSGDGAGGGGGGGGYYGGGGSCFAGGGGGSSYTAPGVTSVTHTQGNNNAAGQVVITYTSSGSTPATPSAISGLAGICTGTSTSYSINPVGGATSYTWTVPSGSTINSGQGTTTINVTAGTTSGNVTVTADNSCGSSAPATFALTINALPTITNTATSSQICVGGSTTINAYGAATYNWMPGNLSGGAVNVSPGVTTTYTITGTDVNGCVNTTTVSIAVNALPVVALGADVVQCGGTATLDAGNAGSTYLWNNASTNQTLAANTSGPYYVEVTDANGCIGADTIVVTINTPPTVSLGTDVVQCAGAATLDAGNAGSSYLWSNGDTSQITIANTSGFYFVTVTDGNGCTGADTIQVTINPNPAVTAAAASTSVCTNDVAVVLTGTPAGGTWTGPGVTGSSFDPATAGAGTHTLTYTYTDVNGCTNSATVDITVNLCLGIAESALAKQINVFPNPNNGQFVIAVNTSIAQLNIEISDMEGRVVYSSQLSNVQAGFSKQIAVENLAAGVYSLRLTSGNEQRIEKISIQK